MEKNKCNTVEEELRGNEASDYGETEGLEGTMLEGTSV